MTHQSINLYAIDFSNPEGEFLFKGQYYWFKHCLGNLFIRDKRDKSSEFICYIRNLTDGFIEYRRLTEDISLLKDFSLHNLGKILEYSHNCIYRCVQHKEALFGFGIRQDKYYSSKYNEWIYLKPINYQPFRNISLDEVLKNSYDFFFERAATVYSKEVPLIEDEDLFYSRIHKEHQRIEFLCGSKLELERLTKLVAFSLSEFQSIFRYSSTSSIMLIYGSKTYDYSGGVYNEIRPEGSRHDQVIFSLPGRVRHLLELIFKYNFFTGVAWSKHRSGIGGYPDHYFQHCTINVEVQAPSQHERLEAKQELQNWLLDKLSEEEIIAYFE